MTLVLVFTLNEFQSISPQKNIAIVDDSKISDPFGLNSVFIMNIPIPIEIKQFRSPNLIPFILFIFIGFLKMHHNEWINTIVFISIMFILTNLVEFYSN